MSNLRRNDDAVGAPIAWDKPAEALVTPDPSDRRTPPAAERLFASLAMPWDTQIGALEAASAELRAMLRAAERLHQLDGQLLRVQNTEKLARLDLAELAKRRQIEIAKAVSSVGDQPRISRKRRLEEARETAALWHDQKLERTGRLTRTRLHTAEREGRRLLDERQLLLSKALITDPDAIRLMEELLAAVTATLTRDRAARGEALGDWARLRGTDERIQARLRQAATSAVLAGQAFGEGPIHLIAGTKLALVESRRGRDGIRTEEVDGDLRLWQVLPHADHPLGLTDGSTRGLFRAAKVVEAATGTAPALIICVSGWATDPADMAGMVMCGTDSLAAVLHDLPDADVPREKMKVAARALAALELPDVATEPVSSLDHLCTLAPEDIPDGIPAVRNLIIYAHERRHDAYQGTGR